MGPRFPLAKSFYDIKLHVPNLHAAQPAKHGKLCCVKAELLLLKLSHLFAREVLLVKKFEVEETKTTQYSIFKTDIIKVDLVFSIFNFFITKTTLANIWMRKKIPSCSNSALAAEELRN